MLDVRKGDIILHSYNRVIKGYSIATSDCYESDHPSAAFHRWNLNGWKIDVQNFLFDNEIKTADIANEFHAIQPANGPIAANMHGKERYLCGANKAMIDLLENKYPVKIALDDVEIEKIINVEKEKEKIVKTLATKAVACLAIESSGIVIQKETKSKIYIRNQMVKEYSLRRAGHKCDLCNNDAPFKKKDNSPYLESHHVIPLADNGIDSLINIVALCPNCHRKMHIVSNDADVRKLKTKIFEHIEKDEDIEYEKMIKLLDDYKKYFQIE